MPETPCFHRGHITPDELRAELQGSSFIANGFINRFLIVDTQRLVYIPRNGNWQEALRPFLKRVAEAISYAKAVNLIALGDEAGSLWDSEYRKLEHRPSGLIGAATGRASDYTMKLAMSYALMDKADSIRLEHLKAGLALWRYCEASAFKVFGGGKMEVVVQAEPEPLWLRLLNAIQATPGIARSDLLRAFRGENADGIGKSLAWLHDSGHAHPELVQSPNGGPKAERWHPAKLEPEAEEA